MSFKKVVQSLIIGSLLVPAQLMSQSTILEVAQARKRGLFSMGGRLFALSQAGARSLQGIEKIPGIGRAWALALSGNDVEVLEQDTFNHPQFKNLYALDLSSNKINTIQPGALSGLENLNFLWLSGNQLMSIPEGALSGLSKNKKLFVFIGNNPGGKQLIDQVKKQLPQAHVYTTLKKEALKAAALAAGVLAVVVVVSLGIYAHQKRTTPTTTPEAQAPREEQPGPAHGPITEEQALINVVRTESPQELRNLIAGGVSAGAAQKALIVLAGDYERSQFEKYARATSLLLTVPGIDVNAKDAQGWTALMRAVGGYGWTPNAKIKMVQELLKVPGIRVNDQNPDGNPPLIAASFESPEVVEELLLNAPGIDVNVKNSHGHTALTAASESGRLDIVEKLLKATGIDVNEVGGAGNKPLWFAIYSRNIAIIEALLDAGADVDENAVSLASRHKLPHYIIESLKERKQTPITPENIAAQKQKREKAKPYEAALRGARERSEKAEKEWRMQKTRESQHAELAQEFAQEEPDASELLPRRLEAIDILTRAGLSKEEINQQIDDYLKNPQFSVAAQFLASTKMKPLPEGLQNNTFLAQAKSAYDQLRMARYNSDSLQNSTALEAVIFEHPETGRAQAAQDLLFVEAQYNSKLNDYLIGFLKKHGAQVDGKDQFDTTALIRAAGKGNVAGIRALLEAGADVNTKSRSGDGTALISAARHGQNQAINTLIAAHADVNEADPMGTTALHIAADKDNVEGIRALLEAGADVNAIYVLNTPLQVAIDRRHVAAIGALLEAQNITVENISRALDNNIEIEGIHRSLGIPSQPIITQLLSDRLGQLQGQAQGTPQPE